MFEMFEKENGVIAVRHLGVTCENIARGCEQFRVERYETERKGLSFVFLIILYLFNLIVAHSFSYSGVCRLCVIGPFAAVFRRLHKQRSVTGVW